MPDHPSPSTMSDTELVKAYQETTGEPGDPWVEALVEEMARREVDF